MLTDRSENSPLHEVFKKAEPKEDPAWNSEVLADEAKQKLKRMGKLLFAHSDEAVSLSDYSEIVSSEFRGGAMRPQLAEAYRDDRFVISRNAGLSSEAPQIEFLSAVKEWRSSIIPVRKDGGEPIRWKVIEVQLEPDREDFSTRVRLEVDGKTPGGERLSQVAEFTCQWSGGEFLRLRGWKIKSFEEIHLLPNPRSDQSAPFIDRTRGLMQGSESFSDQLALGSDYWYGNFDIAFGVQQGNQGISICDINSDGREDLFVCQPAGLPSRMYLQGEDGTLKDVTTESGLNWLDDARSALFIDLDGDGDEDLALGLGYSLTLHENDGRGNFQFRVEIEMFSWPSSIAAADYDNDGDLDIYVCGYTPRGDVAPGDIFANPVPYQDANNGARNFFIENKGSFNFADVTEQRGLSQNNRRFSLAASWEDYDQDGDQDLYVANDFGRNNLYRNDLLEDGSRSFVDVAAEAGVEDVAAGMSVSWGDYNRDGLMDLYISNMFSSAGGRIAFQQQFQTGSDEEVRTQLQRHARGNTLYQNQGDGTFADVSEAAGVSMGRWAWASHFVDLNNDAWEDLVVTNGFYTAEDSGDL
ncbi:MAG: VCBS repeat-containing protein [Akkermansiaceae bacterium]